MTRVTFSKGKNIITETLTDGDQAERWIALVKQNGYKIRRVVQI